MHFLITGGAGFIGSHLAEALLKEGHELTILDDLSTGRRENVPTGVTFVQDDIAREGVFDWLVVKADACFHLAAIASVERSYHEWLRTHQVNLSGTVNLFAAIAKSKKKIPVVYASSAATYGLSKDNPLSETSATMPSSAYGADKLACEFHGRVAQHVHGIPNMGLRFFNVYGPRQDPASPYSGVISIFAGRLNKKLPLIIHGDGKQSRDFIYVDDIVRGLMLAMSKLQSKEIAFDVINLCTGKATSVGELATLIPKAAGIPATVEHGPARPGDMRNAIGTPERAASVLGFRAQISMEEGLKRTLDWMRNA